MNTKIYQFTQNNSGGCFDTDDKVCHRVLIEALNEGHACDIAENMGIYFDGCDTGHDCPCCGDRWYRPWDSIEFPYIYGHFKETEAQAMVEKYNCISAMVEKPKNGRVIEISFPTVASYAQYLADNFGWTVPDVRVFYLDGTVEEFYTPNTKPDESKTAKKG